MHKNDNGVRGVEARGSSCAGVSRWSVTKCHIASCLTFETVARRVHSSLNHGVDSRNCTLDRNFFDIQSCQQSTKCLPFQGASSPQLDALSKCSPEEKMKIQRNKVRIKIITALRTSSHDLFSCRSETSEWEKNSLYNLSYTQISFHSLCLIVGMI